MEVGRLEVYCGGMFASKSTALQRQGKRHLLAGRKVVFLKPEIDNRYGEDVVSTHDGAVMDAISILSDLPILIYGEKAVDEADVVCIDEVQFFNEELISVIDNLIYDGKLVYVAGLDMNSEGQPFGIMPILMAKAEKVEKYQAVCSDCGEDAYVTVALTKKETEVQVGNGYKPVCRSCSVKYIGGAVKWKKNS